MSAHEQSMTSDKINVDQGLEQRNFYQFHCIFFKNPHRHLVRHTQQKESAAITAVIHWHCNPLSFVQVFSPVKFTLCSFEE
jgi:hypothetical protein